MARSLANSMGLGGAEGSLKGFRGFRSLGFWGVVFFGGFGFWVPFKGLGGGCSIAHHTLTEVCRHHTTCINAPCACRLPPAKGYSENCPSQGRSRVRSRSASLNASKHSKGRSIILQLMLHQCFKLESTRPRNTERVAIRVLQLGSWKMRHHLLLTLGIQGLIF